MCGTAKQQQTVDCERQIPSSSLQPPTCNELVIPLSTEEEFVPTIWPNTYTLPKVVHMKIGLAETSYSIHMTRNIQHKPCLSLVKFHVINTYCYSNKYQYLLDPSITTPHLLTRHVLICPQLWTESQETRKKPGGPCLINTFYWWSSLQATPKATQLDSMWQKEITWFIHSFNIRARNPSWSYRDQLASWRHYSHSIGYCWQTTWSLWDMETVLPIFGCGRMVLHNTFGNK